MRLYSLDAEWRVESGAAFRLKIIMWVIEKLAPKVVENFKVSPKIFESLAWHQNFKFWPDLKIFKFLA